MLKHKEEVNETKYDPNSDFVDPKVQLCVVPISKNEGKFPENIVGTGFLVNYNGLSYIVTAKHVIKDLEILLLFFQIEKWNHFQLEPQYFKNLVLIG